MAWRLNRRQAIIWTNTDLLPIRLSRTNFSEIWIKIQQFSFKNMHLKKSSAKCQPFCSGFIVLINRISPPIPPTCRHSTGTLTLRQNGCHFLKHIFLNENVWILIKISLKFVPKAPINNVPALVQIMAWHLSGDKPLSKPMIAYTVCWYTCRPKWVNLMSYTLDYIPPPPPPPPYYPT